MTSPLTLAGLPRADANWMPHDYKQNVQKMNGLLRKWILTENSLKISNQKNRKIQSSHGEQNKRTTRPQGQKLNMKHVARKKLTAAKLKRAFRIKLFELCKTRTKKSSPDLINFYVISAGHDLANDAGRATTCRCIFKAPWLQTERTKRQDLLKNRVLTGKQFEDFRQKGSKNSLLSRRTKQKNDNTPKAKTEYKTGCQDEINWSKIEKSIQNKTVRTLLD